MSDQAIVALVMGAVLGLAGIGRIVLPTVALLSVVALVIFAARAQPALSETVEQFAVLIRAYWPVGLAGLGGALAGHVLWLVLRGRTD